MAFPKNTIKLGAAQSIFSDAAIQELLIGGKVAGYKATIDGLTYEDTSLTGLCASLWAVQREIVKQRNAERAIETATRIQSGGAIDAAG